MISYVNIYYFLFNWEKPYHACFACLGTLGAETLLVEKSTYPREVVKSRLCEMINWADQYLDLLLPFLPDQMVPDDKIMDIVEYAVLAKWHQMMRLHGFDPIMHMDVACGNLQMHQIHWSCDEQSLCTSPKMASLYQILNKKLSAVQTNFNHAYDQKGNSSESK